MKKLLFLLLLLLFAIPSMAQFYFTISGTVTDIQTGFPIMNQAVVIRSDSSSGFNYYNTVYTSGNGFYMDTIMPNSGMIPSFMFVQTWDCNQMLQSATITIAPAVTSYTQDFQICTNSNPCMANFYTSQTQPLTVDFMDSSVGGGNLRQWDFGDGNTSSLLNPTHYYAQAGVYNVTLTIGALGTPCYNSVTYAIQVWDSTGGGNCQAAFVAIPDSSASNTMQFFNLSTGNLSVFTWEFGDGTTQTIQFPQSPDVTHTYANPGTYMVCLSVYSNDSCFDMTCDTVVVGGMPLPCHAAFTYYTDSNTVSNTYHFIDQSTGTITNWLWNFGDGSVSTEQNPVHNYTQPGYYLVSLQVSSPNQWCFDIAYDTIVVGGGSGCQAGFSYSITPAGGYKTVSFTDLSTGNPAAWQWSFGDGTGSTLQNPVHVYANNGTFQVCLTITGNNCTSTFCQTVVIQDTVNYHQIYGQVFAGNFPINLGMAMIFSLDTNANYQPFIDVSMIDSNGVYYFTQVPDGNYYILAIPFDSNGYLPTYYGNTISWEQATLINLGTPNNPYNINLVPSDQMTTGPGSASGQINMGGLKSAMMDKINMLLFDEQGKPLGFTKVSASGEFDFASMAYGTYYLHAEMPGITSDMVKITLTPEKPHADVVMTFSGNKILGINDAPSIVSNWRIYPNPVSDQLTVDIEVKSNAGMVIEIFNLSGQVVFKTITTISTGNNSVRLPLGSLSEGIYTLRLVSPEGIGVNSKFIKVR